MESRTQVDELAVAWGWVLRLQDEHATQEDLAQWLHWYEAEERHRSAFEEMQSFWHEASRLTEGPRATSVERLLDRKGTPESQGSSRRSWRGSLMLAAAASVLVAVSAVSWLQINEAPTAPPPVMVRETRLPDGSIVDLAARSTVNSYYTERSRLLIMEGNSGEAYFSVAENPQRPFVVQVGPMRVRALGTAFNIRRADERIVVSVTKGVVEIYSQAQSRDAANPVRVAAGNRITWEVSGASEPSIAPVNSTNALAWQQGRLEYHNEPLAAVIADVNRYSREQITLGDAAAGEILFSGTVFTQATGAWIEALPRVFPVQLERRSGGELSLIKK